ncbi:pectinesterase family protein [uncultured Massilia sp.]|uniref:pectinesterase family protein n=1 Tax=uncultured Massilia sp. TaxID=169973 RepID=UPI00258AA180|nr:pectinesterase family protein [uncultured Massilia sp.]
MSSQTRGKRAARTASIAALLIAATCAQALACPTASAWCDDFEAAATTWRLDGGGAVRLHAETGAGNRVLLLAPGAAARPADPAAHKAATGETFVEARLRPASLGDAPRRAVVLVRYADPRNWVGAAVNIIPGRPKMAVELVQMRDGGLTRLRQMGHDTAPPGGYQTLRVELARNELAAWLDGERVSVALPSPAPAGGPALLAQEGDFAFDDLRIGPAGEKPGRIALAQRSAGIGLHAGETVRYPLSALAGDGATPLPLAAAIDDPALAQVAVDGNTLVVTGRRAGNAVVTVSDARDRNVATAIGLKVGPAFAAAGDAAALRGRLAPTGADVQPDTLLRIRFDAAPALGSSGSVRVYRAADRSLVDVIRLGEEADAIGPREAAFKRVVRGSPIRVDGLDAVIRLHSDRLDYGTEYLVEVDAGLVPDGRIGGQAFAGIGQAAGWRFRTRAQAPVGREFTVDDDGPADFRTVQGALNHVMRAVPRAEPVTIRIANGRYEELLYLRVKDNVRLHGESRDGVVIGAVNNDGVNPGAGSGQPASSPAASGGRSVFLAEDADLLALDRLTVINRTKRVKSFGGQAEALHYSSDRGRLRVVDAAFWSEQDTILVRGYAWFYRSLIAGNVDFIWGTNRAALFEESEIRTVGDSAQPKGGGYIVQARTVDPNEAGFVFLNSRLTHGPGPAGNDVPIGAAWLARPGPSGQGDKVVFIHTRMDKHIAPAGWSLPKVIAPGAQPGAGWAEFGSMDLDGKPLDLSQRTTGRILTPEQAARYTSRARVFAGYGDGKGWNPAP